MLQRENERAGQRRRYGYTVRAVSGTSDGCRLLGCLIQSHLALRYPKSYDDFKIACLACRNGVMRGIYLSAG